ncbi:GntR family transcriptional regulator [Ilyobacter polytropus]|uniref:Transcriptional regulator, GntR family n=1 Tax=Ilyobacter polytropus (strain ATCC 51220 / DSM 2926 / LMG 16218 / CuHBu1) TaxID=572544 RepID=E3H6K6_ILYPC|nr:GntR family transcriptional regulator [Ilyobacter polytropus]ADO81891.1 transcriptional regulator, GntR family [Ilyobacter polytropus DSM 2926]
MIIKSKFFHENLSDKVVEFIKQKIFTGEYKKGHHILEQEIANELNISRAPVREGIKLLQNQELIKFIPRKGNYVNEFTMEDIKEIYDIRLLIETSVFEILINEKKLTEEDFQNLIKIIDEMVELAKKEGELSTKIMNLNKKDMEFHRYIWNKSGSNRRIRILSTLYTQLQLAMIIDTKLAGNLENTAKEHYAIIEYLRQGDLDSCIKAFEDHILIYRNKNNQ